jgi:hypothetical protein
MARHVWETRNPTQRALRSNRALHRILLRRFPFAKGSRRANDPAPPPDNSLQRLSRRESTVARRFARRSILEASPQAEHTECQIETFSAESRRVAILLFPVSGLRFPLSHEPFRAQFLHGVRLVMILGAAGALARTSLFQLGNNLFDRPRVARDRVRNRTAA